MYMTKIWGLLEHILAEFLVSVLDEARERHLSPCFNYGIKIPQFVSSHCHRSATPISHDCHLTEENVSELAKVYVCQVCVVSVKPTYIIISACILAHRNVNTQL